MSTTGPNLRRVTLEDVAARAGVSRATASRVVTGHPRVTEATRRAVETAVDELGYSPNRAARSLAARRSDTVALVVSEPSAKVFGDPFFAGTIRGAAAALAESRYQLVLLMTQGDDDRGRVERHLLRGDTDGVLLLSAHADDPMTTHLTAAGIPCVLAGRPPSTPTLRGGRKAKQPTNPEGTAAPSMPTGVGYVDADNEGGAHQAVTYLLQHGRRTVATITGPPDMTPGIDRRVGWEKALRDAGQKPDASLLARGDFTRTSGTTAATALLERRPDIDAIFAASDLMALGALDALRRAGRRVPDDVAVVGFDDSELSRSSDPRLTTVRQPLEDMGWHMADLLVAQLDRHDEPAALVLPTELIVRDSS
jgi:DNA-binding LacI/PurR family transcriptional regulator